jgi:hypothetical protein
MDAAIAQGTRESVREDWIQIPWLDIFLNIFTLSQPRIPFHWVFLL